MFVYDAARAEVRLCAGAGIVRCHYLTGKRVVLAAPVREDVE